MLHTGNIFGSLLITGAVLELRGELGNIGTGLGQHWVANTGGEVGGEELHCGAAGNNEKH